MAVLEVWREAPDAGASWGRGGGLVGWEAAFSVAAEPVLHLGGWFVGLAELVSRYPQSH